MKRDRTIAAFKGMIVGGTMLVPGVSGGSMAMILGIYKRLTDAVSRFSQNKKENFFFLLVFCLGGGIGMLLFAKPLSGLIERYPMPMLYFFTGAVAGGVPLICRQAKIKSFSWKIPGYILIGVVSVLLFSVIFQSDVFAGTQMQSARENQSFLFLLPAGFVAAIALVLPGISVSYLFLMMGLYEELMHALTELSFSFLLPLGAGLLLGILFITKLLTRILEKYPQPSYLVILGFVIASMAQVFPGIPEGMQIPVCLLMLFLGYFAIRMLSGKEQSAGLA